jgi:hypothetical protein
MKNLCVVFLSLIFSMTLTAQESNISKTRFVAGLAGPELFHAGISYRLANISQFGFNAGIAPGYGQLFWPALSLEHRLYFGKNDEKINYKTWFCRQGTTFYPSATNPSQFTINLTVGKDIPFRTIKNGITIDLGVFYLNGSEDSSIILIRSLNLWPALRFAFYFSL